MRKMKTLQLSTVLTVALIYMSAWNTLVVNAVPSLSTTASPEPQMISQAMPLEDGEPTKKVSDATLENEQQMNVVAVSTGIKENSPGPERAFDRSVASPGVTLTGLQYSDTQYAVNEAVATMSIAIAAPTASNTKTKTTTDNPQYTIRNLVDVSAEEAELGLINALSGKGQFLLDLQEESQISIAYIAAVARAETTMGKPGCFSGDYNLFNIRLHNGDYKNYSSYEESVEDFVALMNNRYLRPGDSYHKGFTIRHVGSVYAEATHWSAKVEEYTDTFIAQVSE